MTEGGRDDGSEDEDEDEGFGREEGGVFLWEEASGWAKEEAGGARGKEERRNRDQKLDRGKRESEDLVVEV